MGKDISGRCKQTKRVNIFKYILYMQIAAYMYIYILSTQAGSKADHKT